MPPKKGITFGKIGIGPIGSSLGQLTIEQAKKESDSAGFGKFGKNSSENDEVVPESTQEVEEALGFKGFGKAAKSFDLDALLEESKKVAKQRTAVIQQQQEKQSSSEEESDEEVIGPLPPPLEPPKAEAKPQELPGTSDSKLTEPVKPARIARDSDEDSDESEEETDLEKTIPASLEVMCPHGTKTVSAISVDPAGARLVSGSLDYDVKFWDFAGMDSSMNSFRTLRPCEW